YWPMVRIADQRSASYLQFAAAAQQDNPPNLALANTYYEKSIALSPQHASAYYSQAMLLKQQGDIPRASHRLEQAITLKPDFAEAWNQRGLIHLEAGQLEQALTILQHAVTLDPK